MAQNVAPFSSSMARLIAHDRYDQMQSIAEDAGLGEVVPDIDKNLNANVVDKAAAKIAEKLLKAEPGLRGRLHQLYPGLVEAEPVSERVVTNQDTQPAVQSSPLQQGAAADLLNAIKQIANHPASDVNKYLDPKESALHVRTLAEVALLEAKPETLKNRENWHLKDALQEIAKPGKDISDGTIYNLHLAKDEIIKLSSSNPALSPLDESSSPFFRSWTHQIEYAESVAVDALWEHEQAMDARIDRLHRSGADRDLQEARQGDEAIRQLHGISDGIEISTERNDQDWPSLHYLIRHITHQTLSHTDPLPFKNVEAGLKVQALESIAETLELAESPNGATPALTHQESVLRVQRIAREALGKEALREHQNALNDEPWPSEEQLEIETQRAKDEDARMDALENQRLEAGIERAEREGIAEAERQLSARRHENGFTQHGDMYATENEAGQLATLEWKDYRDEKSHSLIGGGFKVEIWEKEGSSEKLWEGIGFEGFRHGEPLDKTHLDSRLTTLTGLTDVLGDHGINLNDPLKDALAKNMFDRALELSRDQFGDADPEMNILADLALAEHEQAVDLRLGGKNVNPVPFPESLYEAARKQDGMTFEVEEEDESDHSYSI